MGLPLQVLEGLGSCTNRWARNCVLETTSSPELAAEAHTAIGVIFLRVRTGGGAFSRSPSTFIRIANGKGSPQLCPPPPPCPPTPPSSTQHPAPLNNGEGTTAGPGGHSGVGGVIGGGGGGGGVGGWTAHAAAAWHLEAACALAPQAVHAQFLLAHALRDMGLDEKAISRYKKVRPRLPGRTRRGV